MGHAAAAAVWSCRAWEVAARVGGKCDRMKVGTWGVVQEGMQDAASQCEPYRLLCCPVTGSCQCGCRAGLQVVQ
jgi:hypothetical protein